MSFVAKYRGQCSEGDEIWPGEEVEYGTDKVLSHVSCDSTRPPLDSRNATKCSRCFLVHAGECF